MKICDLSKILLHYQTLKHYIMYAAVNNDDDDDDK